VGGAGHVPNGLAAAQTTYNIGQFSPSLIIQFDFNRFVITVAVAWLKAQASNKADTLAYVKTHLADDGTIYGDRYVGFGFTWNPNQKGKMIVDRIVEGSPASKVLKSGDDFIEVEGIKVSEDTIGKLPFRGKPGESVSAIVMRDGKSVAIEVARGIVSNEYGKADLLAQIEMGEEADWSAELTVNEVLSKDDVVYVWTTVKDIDVLVDLPFENHVVTRFQFNADGKVQALGSLSEDRFVLEQTGHTISR